jgi:hypothetical protein
MGPPPNPQSPIPNPQSPIPIKEILFLKIYSKKIFIILKLNFKLKT